MSYIDKPENILQDTKQFLRSELGSYLMGIFEDMRDGELASASSKAETNKEWCLAKYNAYQEVIQTILSPLEDDKPTRG